MVTYKKTIISLLLFPVGHCLEENVHFGKRGTVSHVHFGKRGIPCAFWQKRYPPKGFKDYLGPHSERTTGTSGKMHEVLVLVHPKAKLWWHI
jgi:hypothetical protein